KNDTYTAYFAARDHFFSVTQFCGKKLRYDNHTLLFWYRMGITDGCHFVYLFFSWRHFWLFFLSGAKISKSEISLCDPRIIVALDFPDQVEALELARR